MTPYSAADTSFDQLKAKIQQRQARVGIIGLGYVGLPLALLYSEQKFQVTGFDIDSRKVDTLAKGGSYIYRIAAEEIQAAKAHGFSATADYSQIDDMDAIIICVPTPLNEYHEPDLSYITGTTESIAPHLRAGQLVVLESTTYPGTTEEVMIPILEKDNRVGLKAARNDAPTGNEFFVAFSPEREDPGNTTVARRDIPKVVGGLNAQASELACALYGSIFNRTVPVSSPAAAEMTKLLENIYRCVNIALVNELKTALPAHGHRHLGSHRRRFDQAVRIPSVLSRPRAWADTAFRSIRSIFRGRRKSGTSARASSNWRAKSTPTCPTTCWRRSAAR